MRNQLRASLGFRSLPASVLALAVLLPLTVFSPAPAGAQAPPFGWVAQAGGTSSDTGNAIAVDAAGNSYVTGTFFGPAAFGTNTVPGTLANGNADIFLAKYDPAGNVLWVRTAGGTNTDNGNGIAVDALGGCYVTGSFEGTARFGSTNLTVVGQYDVFVAKYDRDGNLLWVNQAGGTSYDVPSGIAVDKDRESYVTGYYQTNAWFGTNELTNGVRSDVFTAKLDAAGNWLWARQGGGEESDVGRGIAVHTNKNCCVTGFFYSSNAVFAPVFLTNRGPSGSSSDIFVASYDTAGNLLWARGAGGSGSDGGYGIGVDTLGFWRATGFIASSNAWFLSTNVLYPSIMLSTVGNSDVFVAKFDSVGDVRWAKRAGGTSGDLGRAIAVNAAGQSFVTGSFTSNNAAFGGTILVSAGSSDIFVAAWEADGTAVWAKRAGGTASDTGLGIGLDAEGASHVAGSFSSASAAFGVTNLATLGLSDLFVSRDATARPQLTIALAATGSQVLLSWLTNFPGFNLQTASNLPPSAWSAVTNPVGILGDRFAVTNGIPGSSRFFRLRKP